MDSRLDLIRQVLLEIRNVVEDRCVWHVEEGAPGLGLVNDARFNDIVRING